MTNSALEPKAARLADALQAAHADMEHRWGNRRRCRARACISAGVGIAGRGRLRNISMSGAFLETSLPLPLYSQVAVAMLREDDSKHLVEFMATVVRTEPGGVGIEWHDTANGSICRLMGCTVECAAACDH